MKLKKKEGERDDQANDNNKVKKKEDDTSQRQYARKNNFAFAFLEDRIPFKPKQKKIKNGWKTYVLQDERLC